MVGKGCSRARVGTVGRIRGRCLVMRTAGPRFVTASSARVVRALVLKSYNDIRPRLTRPAATAAKNNSWPKPRMGKRTQNAAWLHAGANWDNGSHSGSLSRNANNGSTVRNRNIAARGAIPV